MSIKHCIIVDDFSRNEILDLFQLASELNINTEIKKVTSHSKITPWP